MNFTPKVGPLVAELLSGFTVLLLSYLALYNNPLLLGYLGRTNPLASALHDNLAAAIGIFFLSAWLLGTLFDVLRNLLEHVWDCLFKPPLNWEFFFYGNAEKLASLEHYFYSFYILDADMAIAIALFIGVGPSILSTMIGAVSLRFWIRYILLPILGAIFALDAACLRYEIKRLLREENQYR